MKPPQWLKEHLLKLLIAAWLGLLALAAGMVWNDISVPFWKHIVPAISDKTWMLAQWLLVPLVILPVYVTILLLRSRREPTAREQKEEFETRFGEFDKRRCLYTHKTKEGFFCPKCYSNQIESPVAESPQRWSCPVCQKTYENPDYKKPEVLPWSSGQPRGWKI